MDDVVVAKTGGMSISTVLSRDRSGLRLTVRTIPQVEDFIKGLGLGELVDVKTCGKHWIPLGQEPLYAYRLETDIKSIPLPSGDVASFARLGNPLYEIATRSEGRTTGTVNLAFLKLVGIESEVSFGLKGVFSTEDVRMINGKLQMALDAFYRAYLKPFSCSIQIITQEGVF